MTEAGGDMRPSELVIRINKILAKHDVPPDRVEAILSGRYAYLLYKMERVRVRVDDQRAAELAMTLADAKLRYGPRRD